ncbi:MAG: zinc-binding dehydrogenase [Acetobacteraceae bacterium]
MIARDPSPERRAQACAFGARAALEPPRNDTAQAIRDLTHGRGADLSLHASGTAEGRSGAVRAAGKWGTVCFVGEGSNVTIEVSPEMLRKQLTIVGSWTFSTRGQAECAGFVAERGIAVDDLVTPAGHSPEPEKPIACSTSRSPARPSFSCNAAHPAHTRSGRPLEEKPGPGAVVPEIKNSDAPEFRQFVIQCAALADYCGIPALSLRLAGR